MTDLLQKCSWVVEYNPETGSKRPFELYVVRPDGRRFLASFASRQAAEARKARSEALRAAQASS